MFSFGGDLTINYCREQQESAIADADADVVFVIAATAWEAGIKASFVNRFLNTVT